MSVQRILSTGSISGFHTRPNSSSSYTDPLTSHSYSSLPDYGSHYLSSTPHTLSHQPFCGNSEGWGPLSPHRYDFTPCFMDVWVSSVAVYGVLFGLGAVWWLVRRKTRAEVRKDWHFWSKQVCLSYLWFWGGIGIGEWVFGSGNWDGDTKAGGI